MLELNPDAAHVVGVKLAPDQITIVVTNFRADVLRALVAADPRRPPAGRRSSPISSRTACAAASPMPASRVDGDRAASASACPASSSAPPAAAGRARSSASATSRSAPELSARLGVPVTVDSDVNLVTLAEHWFGHGRGLDDFLVVSVEHGLGLGVMHNGELFRGANGLSPDLGDLDRACCPPAPPASPTSPRSRDPGAPLRCAADAPSRPARRA